MKCSEIEASAILWFSGELEPARKRAFDRHVSGCPACARFLEEQAALDARILAAFGEQPAGEEATPIGRRVMMRIAAERRRRLSFALAAAALVVLALTVGYRNRPPEPVARVFADAARDHRVEVIERKTRRWRTESPDVEELAVNFGLTGDRATGLAPLGYRFARARTCGLEGRPALHLVYTDGVQEVSVYVRRGGGSGAMQTAAVDGEQLASLRTAGYEAIAVSTGSAKECAQMVRRAASML